MTLDTLIMLAGAFVAAISFLGFPASWDTWLLVLAGIIIIGLGVVVRRKEGERQTEERKMRGDSHQ
ncbi:MAG: hypothetical protein RLZZ342_499 [Candidatus Parcubacteria bacterium]|jgi:putative Mn2+ efflux pump MntP